MSSERGTSCPGFETGRVAPTDSPPFTRNARAREACRPASIIFTLAGLRHVGGSGNIGGMPPIQRAVTGIVLASLFLAGQTLGPAGSVQGTVTDPSGAALAGARVTALHLERNLQRQAETDAEGRFALTGLPIGTYRLSVERPGFAKAESGEFSVSVGQVVTQTLTLDLTGVTTKMEVAEQAEAIEAAATSASVALGGERIEEMPARSRNYLNFVAMAPGLAASPAAGAQRSMTVLRNPVADSGFTFQGLRGRNNSVEVDGVDNRDETTGGSRVAVGLEMVQEFRVAGAMTGAELGGAAGGLLNVVTRTGVNLMHGDVTFFVQNEAFNATRSEVAGSARPRYLRWQPGASWYGPLRRDRTFLAAAVEAERESAEEWSDVPEEAESRINAVLRKSARKGLPVASVLRGLYGTAERGEAAFAKLNHQTSDSDSLAVRYAFSRGRAFGDVQPGGNFLDRSAGGSSTTLDHALAGNWFHVASPKLVLETRAQFGRREQTFLPNAAGPLVEIPGVVSFGQHYRLNSQRSENHWQGVEAVDVVRGRHRLSLGASLHSIGLNAMLAERWAGIFVFPTLEDFEQGRADVFTQAFGNPATSYRTMHAGAWLQDRWQVRDGLLLEVGIRVDRQGFTNRLPGTGALVLPRFGLSWRPVRGRPLVLRAGVGLFADRYPLAWLNAAVQRDGAQGFEQYAVGRDAEAAFALALQGPILAPLAGLTRSAYSAAPDLKPVAARKITAGAEYGLDSVTSLTVQASWVRGWHLPRTRNAALTLAPQWDLEAGGNSRFRGLSLSLNRKLRNDLAFMVNYDVSRTLDDGSDFDEQPSSPANARLDWGPSRLDQRQRLAANAMWEFGMERGSGLLHRLLSRWNLSPVVTLGSGRPLNALYTTDRERTGAYPLTARPAGTPRNPNVAQPTVQVDARLMKTIPYRERRMWLQFGVETFNLLNHTNPVSVSEYRATPRGLLASYGRMAEAGAPRQVQFFMQFEY